MEEVQLADEVGLDVFGIGEHHRPDFAVSAPAIPLAAAAATTTNIRLTSAVTVLSSDDPVRVFQDFATLDLISGGRAEIMAGRGSFIESFPLFGFDLDDYDELFAEKLDLLLNIRANEEVTWRGKHRAAIDGLGVYPRPVQEPLPVWLAVGGNPQSVIRAASLGLPLAIAIIGGDVRRFVPFADLYRQAAGQLNTDPDRLAVSINSHGFVADTGARARDRFFGPMKVMMDRIGRERGWPPMTRAQFEEQITTDGALFVGEPEAIAEKILYQHELFKHDRFLLQMTVGTMPHDQVMHAIELYGTKVAPLVREEIARRKG